MVAMLLLPGAATRLIESNRLTQYPSHTGPGEAALGEGGEAQRYETENPE